MTEQFDIYFLSIEEVLNIHAIQIKLYGGRIGLRDQHLLESALNTPTVGFGGKYLHADIFEMASAYMYHIINNHPFVDGNKRTGSATALIFLESNDIPSIASHQQLVQLAIDVAIKKISKEELATILRVMSSH